MAQLYEVSFTAHFPNIIDTGKVLVCAPNQEMAADSAAIMLELPRSITQCVVTRVRPAVYIIERREIDKSPKPKMHNGTSPSETVIPFMTKFHMMIEAVFTARTEEHALRKLVNVLNEKLACRKRDVIVPDLKIDIFPLGSRSSGALSPLEKIEMYRPSSRGLQGGQVRSK